MTSRERLTCLILKFKSYTGQLDSSDTTRKSIDFTTFFLFEKIQKRYLFYNYSTTIKIHVYDKFKRPPSNKLGLI